MKKCVIIVAILCLPAACLAYEASMFNLAVPTNLVTQQADFNVRHRFFGPVDDDPLETLFGTDAGANVNLIMRGPVWRTLEVRGGYTRDFSEWTLGAGYMEAVPEAHLRAQAGIEFFSFEESDISGRDENLFYYIAVQAEPIAGRFVPVLNLGYDGHNERFGLGLGARLELLERLSILGEYYPVLDRDEDDPTSPVGPEDAFAFGFEFRTYGHHFAFLVGNSWDMSPRRLMLGTFLDDLYFGFNIQRLLEF